MIKEEHIDALMSARYGDRPGPNDWLVIMDHTLEKLENGAKYEYDAFSDYSLSSHLRKSAHKFGYKIHHSETLHAFTLNREDIIVRAIKDRPWGWLQYRWKRFAHFGDQFISLWLRPKKREHAIEYLKAWKKIYLETGEL